MIRTVIEGVNGQSLIIDNEGAAGVVLHNHPSPHETLDVRPYRAYFTTDAGASDMLVNGSVTSVTYSIRASTVREVYIKTISCYISDASATLNKFGNITALTNGLSFDWLSSELGTVNIHDALKTNFNFVRLALGNPSFGDGAGAFRAGNVLGTSEAYIPVIDLAQVFGMPYGIRLRKGSNDRLSFTVRDDITGIEAMDIIAYGLEI